MNDFQHILVGVELKGDGTEVTSGSRKAFRQGLWVAKSGGGDLTLLHSLYYDERREALEGGGEPVHEGIPDAGRRAFDGLLAEARESGVEARIEYTTERPWMDISRRALREEVDLVVVGKREKSGDDSPRLGSVSTKLLRKCPCAVWAVKPGHDLVQRLVLGAVDMSPTGMRVACTAASIAREHECELHLVHALKIPFALQMEAGRISDEEFAERIDGLKSDVTGKLREEIRSIWPDDEKLTLHIGKGAPLATIQEAIAHLDPDLLVMGTAGEAIAGVLLGTTAERLLPRVGCSILALKPEGFVSPVGLD